jgi:Cft2 family RNA processing exonuclease
MDNYFLAVGGGNEIGASAYLLVVDGIKILIDAGIRMHGDRAFPDFSPLYDRFGGPAGLDAFLLTHAHLDHCGAVTRLHYEAPRLAKYATQPTLDIAAIMLGDALRVAGRQHAEDWSVMETTRQLLDETLNSFYPIAFDIFFTLGRSAATAMALKAGHILGAASYLIEVNGRRILHTGDLSLHDQRTIPGAAYLDAVGEVDLLIIESTYAYQPEQRQQQIEEEQYALLAQISKVVERQGHILIPAFALGRAQEVAALLVDAFEQELVAPFPVWLDGLVTTVTDCYNSHRAYLQGRLQARGDHALYNQWVQPVTRKQGPHPEALRHSDPMCVVASSGMLLDGTRSARYAQAMLPNPKDAIFFSGYLDEESPGRRLLDLTNNSRSLWLNGSRTAVSAEVGRYHLSAHASSADLQRMIRALRPRIVVLIHGDHRFDGDPTFIATCMQLEREGIQVYQAANGVPIYL